MKKYANKVGKELRGLEDEVIVPGERDRDDERKPL